MDEMTDPEPKAKWKVVGLDSFAHEQYFVSEHETEAEAREAARQAMAKIERTQTLAGGPPPTGIRDVVWVVSPDGQTLP